MGIANFPFPSFTLVLTSDQVVIPGPSYVIRLAPHVPQTTPLSTNVDITDDEVQENYPLNFENDSTTDVELGHSDPEEYPHVITEIKMSTPTNDHETRTVQTTRCLQEEVGKQVAFHVLKMRPTAYGQLKSIFKRLLMAAAYSD